jgi:hypothetical protein
VKRLRVELQVANVNQALQSTPALLVYQPSPLGTPYVSTIRNSAFTATPSAAAKEAVSGNALVGQDKEVDPMVRNLVFPAAATPVAKGSGEVNVKPEARQETQSAPPTQPAQPTHHAGAHATLTSAPKQVAVNSPARSSRKALLSPKARTPEPHRAAAERRAQQSQPGRDSQPTDTVQISVASPPPQLPPPHSPTEGANEPPSSGKNVSFRDSSRYAAKILRDIMKEQTLRLSGADGAHEGEVPHDAAFLAAPPTDPASRKYIGKSPSTKDIHRVIMDFMHDHHLDPRTHYSGIIKAIKIQVLSQLLSRDLSQQAVHDTAMLMAVSSPSFSASKGGSQPRKHRYFASESGPLSPVPLPSEYHMLAQAAGVDTGDTPASALHDSSTPHAASAERAVHQDTEGQDQYSSDAGSDFAPHSTRQQAPQAPSTAKSESGKKFEFPNARRDAATKTHGKKTWVAGSKRAPRSVPSPSSPEQIQRLAAKALQTAVSALSETFKEEMLTETGNRGCIVLCVSYARLHLAFVFVCAAAYPASWLTRYRFNDTGGSGKKTRARSGSGSPWRHHSSVRRSCSCAGCRAASVLGDSTDDYDYQSGYNRHGHRITPKGLPTSTAGAAGFHPDDSESDSVLGTIEEGHSPEGPHGITERENKVIYVEEDVRDGVAGTTSQMREHDSSVDGDQQQFDSGLLNSTVFDVSVAALDRNAHDTVLLAASPIPGVPSTTPAKLRERRSLSPIAVVTRAPSPGRHRNNEHSRAGHDRTERKEPPVLTHFNAQKNPSLPGHQVAVTPAPVPQQPRSTRATARADPMPAQSSTKPPGRVTKLAVSTTPGSLKKARPAPSAATATPTTFSDTASSGRRSPTRSRYCSICLAVANMQPPPGAEYVDAAQCAIHHLPGNAAAVAAPHTPAPAPVQRKRGNAPAAADNEPVFFNPPLVAELGRGTWPGSRGSSPMRGSISEPARDAAPPPYQPVSHTTHHGDSGHYAVYSEPIRASSPVGRRMVSSGFDQGAVGGYDPPALVRTDNGRAVTPQPTARTQVRVLAQPAAPFTPYASRAGAAQQLPLPQPPTVQSHAYPYTPHIAPTYQPSTAQSTTEFTQLLALLQQQQREIDTLRAQSGVQPATFAPIPVPATLAPPQTFHSASTEAPAAEAAHGNRHNTQHDEPISVYKPRLGGSAHTSQRTSSTTSSLWDSNHTTPYGSMPVTTLGSAQQALRPRVPLSPGSARPSLSLPLPSTTGTPLMQLPSTQLASSSSHEFGSTTEHGVHATQATRSPDTARSAFTGLTGWTPCLATPQATPHFSRTDRAADARMDATISTAPQAPMVPYARNAPSQTHMHYQAPQPVQPFRASAETHSVASTASHGTEPFAAVPRSVLSHPTALQSDPTVNAILRCLTERIERLTARWQQTASTELMHPEYGVAVNADGTPKAYVDVSRAKSSVYL